MAKNTKEKKRSQSKENERLALELAAMKEEMRRSKEAKLKQT